MRHVELPKEGGIHFAFRFPLYEQGKLHQVVVAPHGGLAAGYLTTSRNIVPPVGLMVYGMQEQTLMARVGREIRWVQQGIGDGHKRQRYKIRRLRSRLMYLVVFIDLYSRRVVGWALSSALDHRVALVALQRAVVHRRPPRGLIIHSDRGVQYACTAFAKWVNDHGFVQSMSRKGDCWDNAVAESFFHLLKTELTYHERWLDYQAAYVSLFEYIEIFYNRERSHSTLDYATPAAFELHSTRLAAWACPLFRGNIKASCDRI